MKIPGVLCILLLLFARPLYPDQNDSSDKPPPAPGGIYGVHIMNPKGLPYDVKLSMVQVGVQFDLPELDAKIARGEKLTDQEQKALPKYQEMKKSKAMENVHHELAHGETDKL